MAIDGLYILDAQSGALVPVAGDFTDDGSGAPKWFQALVTAYGALDGSKTFVADVDGQRFPVADPRTLAALQGVLRIADNSDPLRVRNQGHEAVSSSAWTQILPADVTRTKAEIRHTDDDTTSGRVWLAFGSNPGVGVAVGDGVNVLRPDQLFSEYMGQAIFARLQVSGTTDPVRVGWTVYEADTP